jgi:hypothetical protein
MSKYPTKALKGRKQTLTIGRGISSDLLDHILLDRHGISTQSAAVAPSGLFAFGGALLSWGSRRQALCFRPFRADISWISDLRARHEISASS